MDKVKKRVRAHAEKHGMSYQAAWNLLEGGREKGALEFWDWVGQARQGPHCLTIGDVLKMKEGDRLPLLLMHRNLCDHVYPHGDERHKPARRPEEFFDLKRDGAVYVHGEGISGTIEWGWDDAERFDEPFTFEVEYAPRHWYPLKDGRLPTREEIRSEFAITTEEFEEMLAERYPGMPFGKHWKELPETTLVGWRGPVMRWDDVSKHPLVFTKIDLDHLADDATLPLIQDSLGISADRMFLRLENRRWTLIVKGLTEDERETLERRFQEVTVVSRKQWYEDHGVIGGEEEEGPHQITEEQRAMILEGMSKEEEREELAEAFSQVLRERMKSYGGDKGFVRSFFMETLHYMFDQDFNTVREGLAEVLGQMTWPDNMEPVTIDEVVSGREEEEEELDVVQWATQYLKEDKDCDWAPRIVGGERIVGHMATVDSPFGVEVLAELMVQLEARGREVEAFVVSYPEYSNILAAEHPQLKWTGRSATFHGVPIFPGPEFVPGHVGAVSKDRHLVLSRVRSEWERRRDEEEQERRAEKRKERETGPLEDSQPGKVGS